MNQYVGNGDRIDYTPSSNKSAGDVVVLGELVGFVQTDILADELGALLVNNHIVKLAKLSTDVVTAGAKLYWDAGNSRLTTTASTHKIAGLAAEDAGSGVTEVRVILLAGLTT